MTRYVPVIIIGAGRSGTNILRDTLCKVPGFTTWPCDEINYIWRHGNRDWPNDELRPEHATPDVRRFIRRAFDRIGNTDGARFVVEKTCANSLRVGFVAHVFPEARYIHLTRDGRDVVASAMQRWTAPLDLVYLARKARFVPPSDLPFYAARYARSRLHRLRTAEKRLGFWGPRFEGSDELVRSASLAEVCAVQWRRCVELAQRDFASIPSDRVLPVIYEGFAADPETTLRQVADFLDLPAHLMTTVSPEVHTGSISKWRHHLRGDELRSIEPIVRPLLTELGYEWLDSDTEGAPG